MKELSIEEKAKAYDIALDKIKRLLGTGSNCSREDLEYVFHELAESEDERIRKEIMELVMQPTWKTEKEFHRRNELCTWLEKQGEQSKKHDVCDTCNEKDSCISPCCVKLVEKQGEQKPVGFNIGDEITVNGQICRVVAVDKDAWSEEPVSGALEKASKEWLKSQLDKDYEPYGEGKMMELTRFDGYAMLDAIEFGAQWQKEQEYTCYEEAFEDGASWKKEQMMANAIETIVHIDAGGYPYIPQIELYNYIKDVPLAKEGDKYKVVLIKENKDE